jgi:glycosyltransferase involved in cell wall biosynthesis
MAEAALHLLGDEDLRRRFGEAGRRRAVEVFGQNTVVQRYRALYDKVTGRA